MSDDVPVKEFLQKKAEEALEYKSPSQKRRMTTIHKNTQ